MMERFYCNSDDTKSKNSDIYSKKPDILNFPDLTAFHKPERKEKTL